MATSSATLLLSEEEQVAVLRLLREETGDDGPTTPDDDATYGPELDDPRASGRFHDPYEVPDFDPALEQHGSCCEAGDH